MVRVLLNQKNRKRSINNNVKTAQNRTHKITDYFNIRKSQRRTGKEVQEEKKKLLEYALRKGNEDDLEVKHTQCKGRAVFAKRNFSKGEFVVEYSGELIDIQKAYEREAIYEGNKNTGCYMYYFKHNGEPYCIDATAESNKKGRLVNHSRFGNLITKTMVIDRTPRLVLIAKTTIMKGEELLYDYGDRSKESLEWYPWLAF